MAQHANLQIFIRKALLEIDDADGWLSHDNVDTRPAVLAIIDMDLAFAEYRVNAATCALRFHGVNAQTID